MDCPFSTLVLPIMLQYRRPDVASAAPRSHLSGGSRKISGTTPNTRHPLIGARSEWSPGVLVGGFSGAAVGDCPAFTERDLNAVTGRDLGAGCGLLVVERVVDRVPGTTGAFCASCASGCAIGSGSASRAVKRGNGKEKVYGSIP